jgi:2-methylcitrate dehydratase PrpD
LFNGLQPFRLLGVPLLRSEKRYDVDAIDLHTMDRIRFEISNEFVRLYLPKGACANTVVRFWSNFEQKLAAETKVTVGEDSDPLGETT